MGLHDRLSRTADGGHALTDVPSEVPADPYAELKARVHEELRHARFDFDWRLRGPREACSRRLLLLDEAMRRRCKENQ